MSEPAPIYDGLREGEPDSRITSLRWLTWLQKLDGALSGGGGAGDQALAEVVMGAALGPTAGGPTAGEQALGSLMMTVAPQIVDQPDTQALIWMGGY